MGRLATFAACAVGLLPAASAGEPTTNGYVLVYVQRTFPKAFRLSASATLPARPTNASWYCSWIMILPISHEHDPPFVQVGLMRRPGTALAGGLESFVATKTATQTHLAYADGSPLGENGLPHVVSVAVGRREIALAVDGTIVAVADRDRYFPMRRYRDFYAQLGSEVSRQGDAASGSIADITVEDLATERRAEYRPRCGFEDVGLQLDAHDGAYVATGRWGFGRGASFVDVHTLRRSDGCPPR